MTPAEGPKKQPWACARSWVSQEAWKHPSPRGSAGAPRIEQDSGWVRLSLQISRELHVASSQEHQPQLDGLPSLRRCPAGSLL